MSVHNVKKRSKKQWARNCQIRWTPDKNITRTSDDDDGAGENKFETQNAHLVLIKNQDFSRNLIKGMKTKEVINILSTTPWLEKGYKITWNI